MPSKDIQYLHVSTWTVIRFFMVVFGIVALYLVSDILAALIFAVIVASAIEPAVEWLKEHKIPRILGVILIYLAIALALFFVVYLIFPLIFEESQNISLTYPAFQKQILSGIGKVEALPFPPFFTENLEEILRIPATYLEKLGGGIFDFATIVFGGLLSFILVVVFSFYLAAQEKGIESFLRLVTPLAYEPYAVDLWERSQRKLGRWLRAQMLLGAIVGVLIFFGLTVLGVRPALFFAILAALFEIIPVVGPILAAVPAVAAALLISPVVGVFTIVLYVVVQQTESHVIVPVVMKKTVGLSPLVVVLALLVGAKIGGIFGILLSVPITAILAEFINDWDKKKRALLPE
ncbi:MAG: AI-2E family transporter [Candidatus Sungbacteria bacterium]|nr:AI-2E family transporter [Candidatus Sungbacteria bacterium]